MAAGSETVVHARLAGPENRSKCSLIITEGKSAGKFATNGIPSISRGRDFYGVLSLEGKLMNVRGCKEDSKKILADSGVRSIKNALLGNRSEKHIKNLNYGKILILPDKDDDGVHITCLIINLIDVWWPQLFLYRGFINRLVTPVMKVFPTRDNEGDAISFFSKEECEDWWNACDDKTLWTRASMKGVGTSNKNDAIEYFANLVQHTQEIICGSDSDRELIRIAFSKQKTDIKKRREWIENFEKGKTVDHSAREVQISDLFMQEFVQFMKTDLERSIQSAIDGMKPGQRRILCTALKINEADDKNVALGLRLPMEITTLYTLASTLSDSKLSLESGEGCVAKMAKVIVGKNNIPLLRPHSDLGTRVDGGKTESAARYSLVGLNPLIRYIFPATDDKLLEFVQTNEPYMYTPVIPMVLVNGQKGIACAYSTDIPSFNPWDLIEIERMLLNRMESMDELDTVEFQNEMKASLAEILPWYNGFNGIIKRKDEEYVTEGLIEEEDDTHVRITELPVHRWTNDFRKFLTSSNFVVSHQDCSETEDEIDILVELTAENLAAAKRCTEVEFAAEESPELDKEKENEGLIETFKLTKKLKCSNMHLLDEGNKTVWYESILGIIMAHYKIRFKFYEQRQIADINRLEKEMGKLNNRIRFLRDWSTGDIKIKPPDYDDLISQLEHKGYDQFEDGKGIVGYNYLVNGLGLEMISADMYEKLLEERRTVEASLAAAQATSAKEMWLQDLEALEQELNQWII